MANHGNYRIENPSDPRGFTYFASDLDALIWGMEVCAETPSEEFDLGPIEVRCHTHGWTPAGDGDICGECMLEEELKSELTALDCDAYCEWLADTGVENENPWAFRG